MRDGDPATNDSLPDLTIINGSQNGSCVKFVSGEGLDSVLDGFTLINGNGTPNSTNSVPIGGGIICDIYGDTPSSPTIRNNIITGNTLVGNQAGGGIACWKSSPLIENNTICNNVGARMAGGLYLSASTAVIINNKIFQNTAGYGGGINIQWQPCPKIINNIIYDNTATKPYMTDHARGGAIFLHYAGATLEITNNTITGNSADEFGGGLYCYYDSFPTVTNTIFWNNEAPDGNEIYVESGFPTINYCDIEGGWPSGIGNIDDNPLFLDSANKNFRLNQGSPCIDTGDNLAPQIPAEDFDGNPRIVDGDDEDLIPEVDIGCYELVILRVPFEFNFIQSAINAGHDGNMIIIDPGTYIENIDFLGKALFLTSKEGPTNTIIDGNSADTVILFQDEEKNDSILQGFTITNGYGSDVQGGGIHCNGASPLIRNNLILGNHANHNGGGIACRDGSFAIIINNEIRDNQAVHWGGGISCYDSSPRIINNTLTRNEVTIAAGYAGGIGCWNASPSIINSILWGNNATIGPEIHVYSGTPQASYCNIQGGFPGTGNIYAYPLFMNPSMNDFTLSKGSPCIDVGDNDSAHSIVTDLEGDIRIINGSTWSNTYPVGQPSTSGTIDIGADEYCNIKKDLIK